MVATRAELKAWVDYANAQGSIIFFDAAYEAYITEPGIPHSIYEIEGAKNCAIEFRSFSKTAGFTGVRCGLTVVPEQLMALTAGGEKVALNKLWNRRQCTKFNGVSYPVQRAAAAVYSEEGWSQVQETIAFYMENARLIREGLKTAGVTCYGGVNAPYIWLKTPGGIGKLGLLRQAAQRMPCGGHSGQRLRAQRRRLLPPLRLWLKGKRAGGGAPHPRKMGQPLITKNNRLNKKRENRFPVFCYSS